MITKVEQKSISNPEGGWEEIKYSQQYTIKLPEPETISQNNELYYRKGYKLFWRNYETKQRTMQFTVTKEEFESSGLKIGDVKIIKVNNEFIS